MILSNPELELQKKIKYFILTLILLISVKVCFSQYKFIPGYIISVDGDTLKGEILDQDYILSSQTVVYRENDSSAHQRFIPKDIHSYYISDGRYYETRIFEYYQEIPVKELQFIVNTSKESPKRSAFEIIKDTAFLRIVLKGKGEILVYTDAKGRVKYYAETPKGGLKQLIKDKTYYPKNNGSIGFRTKNTIKDTLQYLTSDCEEDLYFEKRSKIYLTDLIDLMMDYNTCINSESEIIQPKQKVKIKFGLGIGLNYTNVLARGEKDQIVENYEFNTKQGLSAGVLIDWYLNSVKEKWVIQTEFSYNQKGANPKENYVRYSFLHPDEPIDTIQIKIDTKYIDLAVFMKYFFISNSYKLRPYINLGLIVGYQTVKEEQIIFSNSDGETWTIYDKGFFPDGEFGIAGKFGLLYSISSKVGLYGEFRTSYSQLFQTERIKKLTNTLYGFTLGVYL